MRWLLGEKRREGKTASSVVVYLQHEVFLGPKACIKMSRGGLREGFRWHTRGSGMYCYILEF